MINPQNQRIAKIAELLEQTKLFAPDEVTLIEDYLAGTAAEQDIEALAFRDLSGVPADLGAKIRGLLLELGTRGHEAEAEKMGNVLFAVGASTGSELFPIQNWHAYDKPDLLLKDPAKKAAIYAARIGMNEYQINSHTLKNLATGVGNDTQVIKTAIGYQKSSNENGKIILLTVYFCLKYRNVRLREEGADDRQGGVLSGVGRLLGLGEKGDKEEEVAIDAEDAGLLKLYGDILVNSLPLLYKNQMPRLELNEIENAVCNDKVDARILKMAGRNLPVNRFIMRLLGGTAFVNYRQSTRLKNVLKICLAADMNGMLNIMDNMDMRGELEGNGGDFYELFGMDVKKYIAWAASKGKNGILKRQFSRNREAFLECMKSADFDTLNRMNKIVSELDPKLYQERRSMDAQRQQAQLIQAFVQIADAQAASAVRDYLNGSADLESLSAYGGNLQGNNNYRWGGRHWNLLQSYQSTYGHDVLSNRCETFLMLVGGYTNTSALRENSEVKAENVKRLFAAVDSEHLGLREQLNGYADAYDSFYMDKWKEQLRDAVLDIFGGYLKERHEEALAAFREAGSTGRCLGVMVLGKDADQNKEAILSYAQDGSKAVREELMKVLYGQRGWEEDILKLLSSKKAAEREVAIRALTNWDSEKYGPILRESLEKEKNGKVRAVLETALHVSGADGENAGGRALTLEDLVKDLHKGGKKRSLAWAYETPFSVVHKKDGGEAQEEYLQAIFLSYAAMSPCGVSPSAAALAEGLDERELAVYANELFDKWMEAGAESKKRWVLYAAAIHGGDDIVKKLQHQIQEWPQAARGAIASEAVQALALSPRPQALLIVDGISRKFKFKQVKAAAGKALDFAASQLGITTEELADRIVPDLGFDENMERCFDYGERKFTVTITTALEIEVFDESGKKLKNLPAPGKRDDQEKAAAAYEEFKQMKKQMKATVSSQKMRLEMALSTGRQWSMEAWRNLFVKNPVMHQFATGLIWGIYEGRTLADTFRYMEDGTFNTEDEEEFALPEGAESGQELSIGLVHPIELSEDSRKAWKEQLEDYEIAQPVEQLDRPVYYRTKEEEDQKSLERFGGCIVNDLSLGGKLQGLGWYRGSVQDAGGFYCYYREDKELSLGVELHFSGSFVGGENEDVTVYEARFYPVGGTVLAGDGGVMAEGIKRGSYVYDEANDSNSCFLKDVPERYFSEIVLQLAKATAASKERNENWKAQR